MARKKAQKTESSGPATIANRRARHDYEFLETHEAGLVLQGSEVKSLFNGRANLRDAYAQIDGGEIFLYSLDIEPYTHSGNFQPERRRTRKLLMHKKEIELLRRKSEEKGLTLIPHKIYFRNGKAKVEIAVARGKKLYDKRESIKEKEEARTARRAISEALD
ncbi:MAG: SsrA-binding protein SmpB [Fimbriimonadaceae bacterium]